VGFGLALAGLAVLGVEWRCGAVWECEQGEDL
jgi:hypothetical protein